MNSKENREEEIRRIANRIWVKRGRPDGEIIDHYYGNKPIKIKDCHWAEAENTYKALELKKEEEIRAIAHRMWLESGKPNGEIYVDFFHGKSLLKDVHWHLAEVEWAYGPDYFRSW